MTVATKEIAAHTPGPWRLKESPHKREFSYFIDAGPELGSYFIAAVNNGTGPDRDNAQLIAAAPELLAALKAFVDPWAIGGDWESKINYDTFNKARTAILKATGIE